MSGERIDGWVDKPIKPIPHLGERPAAQTPPNGGAAGPQDVARRLEEATRGAEAAVQEQHGPIEIGGVKPTYADTPAERDPRLVDDATAYELETNLMFYPPWPAVRGSDLLRDWLKRLLADRAARIEHIQQLEAQHAADVQALELARLNYQMADQRANEAERVTREHVCECDLCIEARANQGAREQIDRLANFIISKVPGEPSQPEGAGDCAIRIITAARERIQQLEAQHEIDLTALFAKQERVAELERQLAEAREAMLVALDYCRARANDSIIAIERQRARDVADMLDAQLHPKAPQGGTDG